MTLKSLPLDVAPLARLLLSVRTSRFEHYVYSNRTYLAFQILGPPLYFANMWVSNYDPRRKLRPT